MESKLKNEQVAIHLDKCTIPCAKQTLQNKTIQHLQRLPNFKSLKSEKRLTQNLALSAKKWRNFCESLSTLSWPSRSTCQQSKADYTTYPTLQLCRYSQFHFEHTLWRTWQNFQHMIGFSFNGIRIAHSQNVWAPLSWKVPMIAPVIHNTLKNLTLILWTCNQ